VARRRKDGAHVTWKLYVQSSFNPDNDGWKTRAELGESIEGLVERMRTGGFPNWLILVDTPDLVIAKMPEHARHLWIAVKEK
jgi:hypothetical protein